MAEQGTENEGQRDDPEVTRARGRRRQGLRWHEGEDPRNSGGGGLAGPEHGAIAALGNLDEQRIGLAFAGVVLEQTRTETAGFDAHGGIDGGVVGATTEDIEGDAVLLERLVGVGDGVVEDVAEEELTAACAAEGTRANDALALRTYRTVVGQGRNLNAN